MTIRPAARAMAALIVVASAVIVSGAAAVMPAPPLELRAGDGSTTRLADLKGRVVLIDFWASWCGPCRASFPALDALYRELHDRGLEVLAINLDQQRSRADAFLAAYPHAMTVLFDPAGESPEAFKVRAMPTSVLVDRAGNIRFTHTGYTKKTVDGYRREIETLLKE
jgi:cytochrome c biogenesis protein CcmG/thiol:disulfide interchange protein DsbE